MSKTIVYYHANCLDGFTGAWAAWKKFGKQADYRGLEHTEDPVCVPPGRDIYFIDYCYESLVMEQIIKKSKHVTVLDHHISQKEAVSLAPTSAFSLEHSGCYLAWKHFHPKKKMPLLVKVIEDNDLFAFRVLQTREYIALFSGLSFDFKLWNKIERDLEDPKKRKEYVQKGKTLLEYKKQLVSRVLSWAEHVEFQGHRAFAVNTPLFYSDAANAVWKEKGVHLGISWSYSDGKIEISLRSDGKVDVSKLAAKYGGGGHRCAAGFWVPFSKGFPWKRLASLKSNA